MALTPLDDAVGAPGRSEQLRAIEAEIQSHDVRHIYLQYTSIPGRLMGKVVPAKHFARIADSGLPWTYLSAGGFAATRAGELIGPTGAAAHEGLLVPDLSTFAILPWDPEVARVFCDHYHPADDKDRPGQPALGDTRANLKRLVDSLEHSGDLQLVTGCEPEMSWFAGRESIDLPISKLPKHVSTAYHIGHIEEVRPILKQVTRYGQALGLDMIQADYEDPGQIEMNFMYGPSVDTADRLTTYRQICMQVAKEFGVFATFMPKPIPGIMANGCHHHISLRRDGKAVLTEPGSQILSDLGRWAVGGLLAHARAMSAVCAQTVNSYARYWDAGLFAPTRAVWGYDNRLALVRALPNRVEFRAPDASCNPYLTHAVLIAAIRDGIEKRIDPGAPLDDDSSEDPSPHSDRFPALPGTLGEAIDAIGADSVIVEALPTEMLETFLAIKRDEWARACGAVTDWARDTYLTYLP